MEEFLYNRADTIQLLLDAYVKVIRVDLTKDEYDDVKIVEEEMSESAGFSRKFSEWVRNFGLSGMVYKDDLEQYLKDTNCENLKLEFASGKDRLCYRYRRKNVDGVFRWVKMCIRKSHDYSDEDQVVILYIEDIDDEISQTEVIEQQNDQLRDAFESAVAANSAKSDFMSRMSHDIRTPLNGIIGMTAIAGAHIDDKDRVADCLTKITGASKHLLALVNDILDLSKIESGKLSLNDAEFNLPELLDEIIMMVQPQIKERGHELNVYVKKVKHEDVIGDDVRLKQVFVNLISNAIKYTPDGGKINITLEELNSQSSKVGFYKFICEDNGFGMTPEFLEHLFDPFERANDTRVNETQGTGLGMTIAKNVVSMMGGEIHVESEVNKGTKFTVGFKIKFQNKNIKVADELLDLPVLVVDDDEVSCESTVITLGELGMKGEYCTSGEDAVARVVEAHQNNEDFFACLIDWIMPGMDGLETTRRIRALVGPEVPIILISAFEWAEIEEEAIKAGADGFISKPLFKSRLHAAFTDLPKTLKDSSGTGQLEEFKKTDFSGKRVLLVEDNELNREIAEEIIHMTGADVDTASDGKISVEKFEASAPGYYDMIFMDIQMPVMDGYEASQTIRESEHADAASIPIIALTANAFVEDMQAVQDAGMNRHMAKPINFDELLEVMGEHLSD